MEKVVKRPCESKARKAGISKTTNYSKLPVGTGHAERGFKIESTYVYKKGRERRGEGWRAGCGAGGRAEGQKGGGKANVFARAVRRPRFVVLGSSVEVRLSMRQNEAGPSLPGGG